MLIKHGESLAGAALAAGFYDQSHFTNAFRQTFGLTPAAIFHGSARVRWYIENEALTERLLGAGLR
jgi:AraC-like DNA-binding protein